MNQDDNWVTGDHLFGLDANADSPIFRSHLDKDEMPVSLTSWTAKDFSEIYVRFYPHLVRHARKFLNNNLQSEEVVQDAFLYLMTSLPELDSEIGVLKFLKWKVRLLSLDVIRAQGKNRVSPIDDGPELAGDLPELDEQLIRADDAAIVSLALAKLAPRQREALIASVYEEKATVEVAEQLMLSENATRQLVFRAKAAFKKALVGEADTQGMAVSELLSLATKKARGDAAKLVPLASALAITLAISIGLVSNQGAQVQSEAGSSDAQVFSMQLLEPTAPAELLEPAGSDEALADVAEGSTEDNIMSVPEVNEIETSSAVDTDQATEMPSESQPASSSASKEVLSDDEGNALRPTMFQAANLQAAFSLENITGVGQRIYVYSTSGMVFDFLLSYDQSNEEFVILNPSFSNVEDSVFQIVSFASTFQQGTRSGSLTAVGEINVGHEGHSSQVLRFTFSGELDRLGQPISASIFIS